MKIKITEIEATAEDLRANRTVADALTDALCRIGETITTQSTNSGNDEAEEGDE